MSAITIFLRRGVHLLLMVLILVSVPSLSFSKTPKCFPREGHCVQVTVNGQISVRLSKPSKRLLKKFNEVSYYVDDTAYEISDPIRGELDVVGGVVEGAENWLGQPGKLDIQVVPLQPVDIASREALVTDPTVQISGQASVAKANMMLDNYLPPGRYLLRVKLMGSNNWDRQTLFLTVAESIDPTE